MKAKHILSSMFRVRGSRFEVLLTLLLLFSTSAFTTVRYVDVNNTNATPPFTNWVTAAMNIQDAVDAAVAGDEIVVTNGTYATGGRNGNRVDVDKPLVLRSVNGPSVTIINGGGTGRCVLLPNNAVMVGFTLTNARVVSDNDCGGGVYCESSSAVLTNCVLTGNWVDWGDGGGACGGTLNNCILTNNWAWSGGGAYAATLNNCTLTGNSAHSGGGVGWSTLNNCMLTTNSADYSGGAGGSTLNNCTLTGNSANNGDGGGAAGGTLNNCILTGNTAWYAGGGADGSTLTNCTLTGNSATGYQAQGGGAYGCTLNNCILTGNSASGGGANYDPTCTLGYCCTSPLPSGIGNINKAPFFVNYAGGNLRLQTNSPCINAGNNSFVIGTTDLDGNPRIVSGTVDIGAYEFQGTGSLISYAWLQHYGLPTDGSADFTDPDHDGLNNWQEWRADTNPTNALSVLRMVTVTNGTPGLQVTWQSVPTRSYWLDRATNLASPPSFSSIASNLAGQVGTTTYADTNAIGPGPFFYRVGVGQ